MEVRIESLIPLEQLIADSASVLEIVKRNGVVVLLQNNSPVYIISKYGESEQDLKVVLGENNYEVNRSQYKLHEAMKIVLEDQPDKTMHAADLADEIYKRNLYRKKDGKKAEATQIRARSANYADLFVVLPKNRIKLR